MARTAYFARLVPGQEYQIVTDMESEEGRLLSKKAQSLFCNEAIVTRTLQKWRPYICPFEAILPHVKRDATVLDIGCGNGLFLGLVASTRNIRAGVGLDISERAVAAAQRMSNTLNEALNGADLRFLRALRIEDWPQGPFDVVSMIDVMHHIPVRDQERAIRAACKRVGPDGLLIYKDMARRPVWKACANRMHDLVMARQWIHYMPILDVKAIVAEEGLTLTVRENMDRFWYAHELRVFTRPAGSSH